MRSFSLSWPDVWAVLFVAWVGISISWSGDRLEGLGLYQNWVAILFVFLWARRGNLEWLPYALTAAVAGILISHGLKPQFYGGFGNENFQAEALWVCLPFLFLWRWVGTAVGVVALAFLLFVNPSSAKWVMLLAAYGWLIWYWAKHQRYWRAVTMIAIMVSVTIVFPWELLEVTLLHRLELFTNTIFMWMESPTVGHGLGSYNFEYPRFQEAHLLVFPWMDTLLRPVAMFPGAAHNEYLELMAVSGVIGLCLGALLLYSCVVSPTKGRAAFLSSTGAALLLGTFSFSFQNPAVALVSAFALGGMSRGSAPIRLSAPRVPALAVGFAATCLMLVSGGYAVAAERLNALARWNHEKDPSVSFMAVNKSRQIYPFDAWPRHQLMLSLSTGLAMETIEIAPIAADNVYAITKQSAPYAASVAIARASYLLNSERWRENEEELQDILAHLHTVASIQGMTWVIEASYRARINDKVGLARAIETGMKYALKHEREQLTQMAAGLQ